PRVKHRMAALALLVLVAACKREEAPPPAPQTAPPASAATPTPAPSRKLPSEGLVAAAEGAPGSGIPAPEPPKAGDLLANIETSVGRIQVRLFSDKAPRTVENFVGLAEGTKTWKDPRTGQMVKRPFYEGLAFHRVVPSFAVQTGDPTGEGN